MKKPSFRTFVRFALCMIIILIFTACQDTDDNEEVDSIKWENESNGTINVVNNTLSDMVLFRGTPANDTILGGIRKSSSKTFDISGVVDDFDLGGYMILRGMTVNEYDKNKSNLANAKAEYTTLVTYGKEINYRTEINPAFFGDYGFKVTNTGRIGIELRQDSPDGAKISYIPPMSVNYAVYINSANPITVYPVYLIYNQTTHQLTSFTPTSIEDTVSIAPRLITDGNVMTYTLPVNTDKLQDIINEYNYPVAIIRCTNNVPKLDITW